MLASFIIFGIPILSINLSGNICEKYHNCESNNIFYKWSAYNVLGNNSNMLIYSILWLIFSFIMICFNIYLRKYVMETYNKINDINSTEANYAILIRKLPKNTK
jgi:uncharacterized membrane protein